ncbi:hypothetical protein B0I35DRAFT_480237 [Stachybotrys elegans]|uniref:Uncharacterized protein n=1 Tax=Stachybotrys elegans TaxID=80388 RepID=A0A8K0SNP6_9HYPO|nr:hypothetical protein B0I35DRAFT_480237 [Stachybotrys elegans]
MPSSTAFGIGLVEAGTLTGTVTADTACPTNVPVILTVPERWDILYSACPTSPPPNYLAVEQLSRMSCHPEASSLRQQLSEEMALTRSIWPAPMYYYSGSVCPEPWTTVGTAAKGDDGAVTSTGMFAPFEGEDGNQLRERFQAVPSLGPNVLMQALEPGETAIACCPSGYTYEFLGYCSQNLPRATYTAETACRVVVDLGNTTPDIVLEPVTSTYWFYGSTVTGAVAPEETLDVARLRAQSIYLPEWEEDPEYEVFPVRVLDAVMLVHGGGGGGAQTQTQTQTATGAAGGEETQTDEPSSAAGRGGYGVTKAAVAIMGVWTVAALVGVGLVAAL